MSQDTNVNNLIINKLTKAQYDNIQNPSDTELYLVTDDIGITSSEITTILGYTPENVVNKATYISSSSTDTQYPSAKAVYTQLNTKQAKLVSGTNIKTINNSSILGSGNITIDSLPSQSGQSGKFLTTNGTVASWSNVSIPTVDQTFDGTSANAQSGVAIAGELANYVPLSSQDDIEIQANTLNFSTYSGTATIGNSPILIQGSNPLSESNSSSFYVDYSSLEYNDGNGDRIFYSEIDGSGFRAYNADSDIYHDHSDFQFLPDQMYIDITENGIRTSASITVPSNGTLAINGDNIVTSSMLSSYQPLITSSAMLSSDLVDDTNHTHKFATSAQLTQIGTNQTDISTINGKIPSQASTSNQLADKAFVNSSVQTATANFRGNWDTWALVPTSASSYPADYAGSTTPTVNDYLVVQDASDYTDDTLEGTWRFKYTGTWSTDGKSGWNPEYQVNETPLTSAQLAALNSGITSSDVTLIGTALQPSDITNMVTTDTDQNITGTKTFVGTKKVAFKQSGNSDKLGFTLYTNNNVEKGYLEFNPTNTIDGAPLMTLGNYASSAAGITQVGFRRYSSVSGASGAYNLLTPLIADAKSPFNLSTTYTNFYLPLGFTDGTNTVLTSKSGLVDLSSILPSGVTVDQTFDSTSANAQSGVAINGAGFLKNKASGTNSLTILGYGTGNRTIVIGPTASSILDNSVVIGNGAETAYSGSYGTALGTNAKVNANSGIQLGYGTNSSANTLSVGFYNDSTTHYNWQLLDGTTGYIPNARINMDSSPTSASTNTVTSGGVYTALSNKQDTLTSGTNIKTINNTSLLGSGNIDVLANTAIGTNSLTISGTPTTNTNAINIGYDSEADGTESIAIGHSAEIDSTNGAFSIAIGSGARIDVGSAVAIGSGADVYGAGGVSIGSGASANGSQSLALGTNANAMSNSSIQIGYGTNSDSNTLSVGFYNAQSTHYNWQLLDGTTGLIPDARISSNIARASAIPTMTYNSLQEKLTWS